MTPKNVKATVTPPKAAPADQTIELIWEMPADKSVPADVVTEFTIEVKPKDSTRWQEVTLPQKVSELHATIPTTGMKEYVDYEFRVTATNKAGKSKPSEPSNSVQLGNLGLPYFALRCLPNCIVNLPSRFKSGRQHCREHMFPSLTA